MNHKSVSKPIRRSKTRLFFGKQFFTLKRHVFLLFNRMKYAKLSNSTLPYVCFSHETPLLRDLKDVDMYLQYNKINNLKIAIKKINGVTLYPGEVFSYWKLIGKPTARKGYLNGMVLQNGIVTSGIGGGLCQLSNLIYWMSIHTPLTIVERHRHGYDVFPDSNRSQPFGSGSTCFYNYGDLLIRNDTNQTYRLEIEMSSTHLIGRLTSDEQPRYIYEVYEKDHIMQLEFWGGYTRHNSLWKRLFDDDGREISDEFVVENHAIMMYSPFLPEHIE